MGKGDDSVHRVVVAVERRVRRRGMGPSFLLSGSTFCEDPVRGAWMGSARPGPFATLRGAQIVSRRVVGRTSALSRRSRSRWAAFQSNPQAWRSGVVQDRQSGSRPHPEHANRMVVSLARHDVHRLDDRFRFRFFFLLSVPPPPEAPSDEEVGGDGCGPSSLLLSFETSITPGVRIWKLYGGCGVVDVSKSVLCL